LHLHQNERYHVGEHVIFFLEVSQEVFGIFVIPNIVVLLQKYFVLIYGVELSYVGIEKENNACSQPHPEILDLDQ
jgi:hypothetical protein